GAVSPKIGKPLRRVLLPRIELVEGGRTGPELLRGRPEVDPELLRGRRGFHRLRGTFRHGVSVARCRTRIRRSGQRYPRRTGPARYDPAIVEGLVRRSRPGPSACRSPQILPKPPLSPHMGLMAPPVRQNSR